MLGDLLTTFFEVARQGSITGAAKQLRVSQPTVTGRIRQLEEMYGVELFHRRAGRIDLSDVGVALMPVAEQLMQQESSADYLLRNAGELRVGRLRIGATGPYYILPSVAAFRRRHPSIALSIDIGNSQQMLDALLEYRIDAAVSSHHIGDERLARVTLATDTMVLVVDPAHPFARRAGIALADLSACHLLLREHGSMTRKVTEDAMREAGVRMPGTTVIGSREAIHEAIRQGLGASVVPLGEVPRDPALRVVPFRHGAPVLHEYLYCLEGRRHTRLLGAFLDCLVPRALAGEAPAEAAA
ncbi:LysR substrate-binding domain-containing protein [Cupriavidus respiraculi]|uniref:HTH-type transcriptional regulator HdfR n=1 Tax=Cupriavidus respiraculi TaxID=195930 RepID=A0ABN7XWT8_9BURK|nr:LysR substrate-binding domain-containing protein [Cupriavidus respiraculi]CAG9165388.1 HTH-type transcriptional regulator HdfR [Cupriavidus respiraculi]